jgi:hypothetical protein
MTGTGDTRFQAARLGVACAIAALCLAGCTGKTSVRSNWIDNASRSQTFSHLLVVGVTPDFGPRCNFEFWMVRDLRSQGIHADASCSSMTKEEPLSRAAIERIVATLHSDGVLAVSLVSGAWRTKEGGSYDTRSSGQYKYVASGYDTGFYGVYGLPVDYYQFKTQPSITNARGQAHVLTKLYDTRDARLVYTIDIKVRDIESSQLGLATITPAIAERLRRDGLIR